jgi:hypothetical protein
LESITTNARARQIPRPPVLYVDQDPVQHGGEGEIVEDSDDIEHPQRHEEPRLLQPLVPAFEPLADQRAAEDGGQDARRNSPEKRPLLHPFTHELPRAVHRAGVF